jgi:DUF1680 family protein
VVRHHLLPPNLERTFAAFPGYFYSISSEGVYVRLYDNSPMSWRLDDRTGLRIRQETNYPWSGAVKLTVPLDHHAGGGIKRISSNRCKAVDMLR